jgi:hypothetical protein
MERVEGMLRWQTHRRLSSWILMGRLNHSFKRLHGCITAGKIFTRLFAVTAERIEQLNLHTGLLFGLYQRVLRDAVLLDMRSC